MYFNGPTNGYSAWLGDNVLESHGLVLWWMVFRFGIWSLFGRQLMYYHLPYRTTDNIIIYNIGGDFSYEKASHADHARD